MNIIVIGLGEIGKHIASVLAHENHNVTVIDSNPEAVAAVDERLDVRSMVGPGGSVKTMKEADTENADLLIAVTNKDEVNILTALIAKSLGAKQVIARVDSRDYLPDYRGTYQKLFGIDLVISPEILSAIEIGKLIGFLGATFIAEFADGMVELMQLTQQMMPGVTGVPLKNLEMPAEMLVTAIMREENLIIPSGDTVLDEGDEVLIIGKKNAIEQGSEFFGNFRKSGTKKVIIMGGGEIGFAVARILEEMDVSMVLIEWSKSRCQYLSEQLNKALIINGDGTDIELLKQQNVGEADVFVAASKRDEVNLMSGLLAKELGSRKTIAIVHRPDYISVYKHLGLGATISPRRFAADQILRYARAGAVVSVSEFELGKGEIVEFIATKNARVVGKKLKNLKIPKGSIFGAIAGERGVIIPTGEDEISAGDKVIVFTTPNVRPDIENLFRSRA
jgi:trk system potassium uptake protein TrkA